MFSSQRVTSTVQLTLLVPSVHRIHQKSAINSASIFALLNISDCWLFETLPVFQNVN
jgi:hypothetical protein